MKKNTSRTVKLIIALIILIILFIFKESISSFLSPKSHLLFQSITKKQIDKIELTSITKKQELYKKDGHWFVKTNKTEWRADEERIDSLIEALLKIDKDEVASTNKNKHKEFEIDKEKITVFTKDKKYTIYVGKSVNFDKNYLRIDSQDEVIVANELSNIFTPDDYRDLALHLIGDETKVTKIEVEFEGKKTTLEKNGADWKIGVKTAKKDRVDFFLNDLKTLKGNDILPKDTILPEINTLAIKMIEDKKDESISFFPKDEQNYFSKELTSDFIFQIPTAYVESLKKEEKDFLE